MPVTGDTSSSTIKDIPDSTLCPVCTAPVEKFMSFTCDGCSRPVHFSCLGLLPEDKTSCERLQRYSAQVKFLCADCNGVFKVPMYNYFVDSPNFVASNLGSVLQNVEVRSVIQSIVSCETEKILQEVTKLRVEVDNLKQSNIDLVRLLTNSTNSGDKAKDSGSYAGKLAANTQAKVLIKPKVVQDSHQTQNDLLRNINLVNENIGVTNSKRAKDGAIIVGCSSSENSKKLKQIATDKLSSDYDVVVLRSEHPKVRIVGIPSCLDKESLMNYLKSQNLELLADATVYKLLNLWPLRKNKKVLQAVIQLDIHTFKKVINAGSLLVGINVCKIYDDTTVTRCFKCNGFNHTQTKCFRPISCPICSGEHHVNTCQAKTKECSNCMRLKTMHGFDIDVEHSAWDRDCCFAFKFAEAKLRNTVLAEPVQLEIKKIPGFKPPFMNINAKHHNTAPNTEPSSPVATSNRFASLSVSTNNFL